MALSNWDTLALDENSHPTNGVFESPLGVRVEIYKNWLYVRDESAWEDGGNYLKPTVMQIEQGTLVYKDVQITAIRGPKDGVYCAVYNKTYPDKDGKGGAFTAMVGIGCYGFTDAPNVPYEEAWLGIEQAEIDFLDQWINRSFEDGFDIPMPDGSTRREEFTSYDHIEELRAIDFSKALRFNQGDAYFAAHLGEDIPATKAGHANPTIMSKVIEGMKADEEDDGNPHQ